MRSFFLSFSFGVSRGRRGFFERKLKKLFSFSFKNPRWKPAPKSLGEDDPKSIMAWLSDGGGNSNAAPLAATVRWEEKTVDLGFLFLLLNPNSRSWKTNSRKPPHLLSTLKQPQKTRPPLPPHNGFGSEEDSANSCLRLSPRARVRRAPSAADAGVEAAFPARLAGPATVPGACELGEGDEGRRFSVRWTPADGAVAVFEEKAPGKKEGKRGRGRGGLGCEVDQKKTLSLIMIFFFNETSHTLSLRLPRRQVPRAQPRAQARVRLR